jgi:hypothetical protein
VDRLYSNQVVTISNFQGGNVRKSQQELKKILEDEKNNINDRSSLISERNSDNSQSKDLDIFQIHNYLEEQSKGAQDVRISNEHYSRLIVANFAATFFGAMGVALCITWNEYKYLANDKKFLDSMIIYNTFCTLGLVLATLARYQLELKWLQSRSMAFEFDTIKSIGTFWKCVAEVVFCLCSPYPYLDRMRFTEHSAEYNTEIEYTYNDILLCFSLCRLYMLARIILITSKYMSPRA